MTIDYFKNSPSKRFALYAISFCLGVALGPVVDFIQYDYLLGAALLILTIAILSRPAKSFPIMLAISLLLLGSFRYSASFHQNAQTINDAPQKENRVQGRVDSETEHRIGYSRVVIDDLRVVDQPYEGRVLIRLPEQSPIKYGDTIVFRCRLEKPEPIGSFAYDKYLESQGILALCFNPQSMDVHSGQDSIVRSLLGIKTTIIKQLQLIVPEPQAAFLSGLIFGGSSSLSKELRDDFSHTGTSHILAASGFNISLFTFYFLNWIISTRLGRRKGIITAALLLSGYVVMAGATPSVLRAAFMSSLILLGYWIRRKASMTNLILAALAILLLANPLSLFNDVGFQLSFVATAAVLTLPKYWQRFFDFLPERYNIRDSLSGSLAAIFLTLPIIIWHFGEVSLVAPLVNLLILPLIPIVMALTGVAIVVGFVSTVIGAYAALPAWALSNLMLHIIRWYAAYDFASVPVEVSRPTSVLIAAVIIFYLWHLKRPVTKKGLVQKISVQR